MIVFPFWSRHKYKKHYEKHIEDNYQNRIGIESEIEFDDGYIINKADLQEGKVKLSEIELVNEIADNLFIKIRSGESFIIPKRFLEFDNFEKDLRDKIMPLSIKWNKELNWKWK